MKTNQHIFIYALAGALALAGCSDDLFEGGSVNGGTARIELSGEIDQLAVTRVNDNGFCDGDVMGVYIVDYNGSTPGTLQVSGNRGDNVRHTFDEDAYKWNSAYDIYWKDKHTPIDVYGYYPFGSPESIEAYPFTVQLDQSTESGNGKMGGYEASDFLWGKVENVAPTTSVIRLPMRHRMANARVTLVEGTGFAAGEWAQTDKIVLAANLVRESTINLADGTVTPAGEVEQTMTVPSRNGDEWRAIVVPQTVPSGVTLFSITIGGVPYKFSKNEAFTYVAGKMNNFSIRVDKKAASGQYVLTLISESITPWENDLVSHDGSSRQYIIINSTAGHLKDSIVAANKDYTQVKNLKITGEINTQDFYFMRDEMDNLQALNLKEVAVSGSFGDNSYYKWYNVAEAGEEDGVIPEQALNGKRSLLSIVLPDKLEGIGYSAFGSCSNLTGSLTIPEGVTRIAYGAFSGCTSMTGTLSLPSTLEFLGNCSFMSCNFNCDLILPDKLKYLGGIAFYENSYLSGTLMLPDGLEHIGASAFYGCRNITGDIKIPQKITNIKSGTFQEMGCNGTLILHDGITNIGERAFSSTPLRGELTLPKNLVTLGEYAFSGCNFSGNLIIPKGLLIINDGVFYYNSRLTGIVEFPENILSIGTNAFAGCRNIEGLVIPASVENIFGSAFENCFYIGSIVCKGEMPARVASSAFNGVPKDNFTLEVPEAAVPQYQTAPGWNEFKRIAAHHELVCRPSLACALNTESTQTLIVDAEGEWEVASKPDWCELSQTSGGGKTEVTLTIKALAKGSGNREGEIVFKLKDEDYTHKCTVSQYDYEYDEDEWLALQTATRGNNGGINIVILGDGYDAEDIANGDYLANMKQQIEYFFGVEPYTTYRDYFNVYTAFPLSQESGVGTVNTIRNNRFNTTYTGGAGLKADNDEIFSYTLKAPTVNESNLNQTLIIIVPNSTDYGGITQMWTDGSAIAFCPLSTDDYPFDSRGVIQHEAGGHGFGKLGDEYIYHNAFIDVCTCTDGCKHVDGFNQAKANGWYDNLSLTGKMHEVPWSHLIFDSRYSDLVDIYEGGFMHSRGVFRSEQNSCMNNNIPYYSTISRESIVKRIKQYAGETYSFEEFVANDKRDAGAVTRSADVKVSGRMMHSRQAPPQIHRGSPLKKR